MKNPIRILGIPTRILLGASVPFLVQRRDPLRRVHACDGMCTCVSFVSLCGRTSGRNVLLKTWSDFCLYSCQAHAMPVSDTILLGRDPNMRAFFPFYY